MKTMLTCAMLAIFGAALAGCDSMTPSDNSSKHEVDTKKTVTDANGNVVQQSESKSSSSNNNP